ncbi:MAG: ActD-like protein [Deltaproteobacteria bacterium]|nr:ActD-like protein [Deltaproteobacteria bacterium]MBW2256748.1 ActD-like protein [Deltaproteobacteria bacterium]
MSPDRVPDRLLERYALGELAEEEAHDVRARLEAESNGSSRLEALHASNEDILAHYPAEAMVPQIERRAHLQQTREAWATRRTRTRAVAVLVPVLAAMLVVAVLQFGQGPPEMEGVRAKGGPLLSLYLHTPDGSTRLEEGASASAADVVQIAYVAADASYGAIVSIDGREAVTLHWPEAPTGSTALMVGGEVALPHAYALDDAPHYERFFLVTSPDPINPAEVVAAARTLATSEQAPSANLDLPPALVQRSFLLLKEER